MSNSNSDSDLGLSNLPVTFPNAAAHARDGAIRRGAGAAVPAEQRARQGFDSGSGFESDFAASSLNLDSNSSLGLQRENQSSDALPTRGQDDGVVRSERRAETGDVPSACAVYAGPMTSPVSRSEAVVQRPVQIDASRPASRQWRMQVPGSHQNIVRPMANDGSVGPRPVSQIPDEGAVLAEARERAKLPRVAQAPMESVAPEIEARQLPKPYFDASQSSPALEPSQSTILPAMRQDRALQSDPPGGNSQTMPIEQAQPPLRERPAASAARVASEPADPEMTQPLDNLPRPGESVTRPPGVSPAKPSRPRFRRIVREPGADGSES